MADIAYPDRREDVINALIFFSDHQASGFPDLTNAIHWLVDDTSWDTIDPADDVGILLKNREEAQAISNVLTPLLKVIDELGEAADTAYFSNPLWSDIQKAAKDALKILRGI